MDKDQDHAAQRAGTEVLDLQFTPMNQVGAAFEGYFRPTMVTDEKGALADDLAEDRAI